MTLFEAVQAVIAADVTGEGPAYGLIDAAADEYRVVLERNLDANGQLADAARAFVKWDDSEKLAPEDANVDWDGFDAAVAQCRVATASATPRAAS